MYADILSDQLFSYAHNKQNNPSFLIEKNGLEETEKYLPVACVTYGNKPPRLPSPEDGRSALMFLGLALPATMKTGTFPGSPLPNLHPKLPY